MIVQVAMAPEGASQVKGGNWQIFSNMVKDSRADVRLNTSVVHIGLSSGADSASKYTLKTKSAEGVEDLAPVEFDHVVIATPYQFSDISAADDLLQHAIDKIPYVKLHVTLFASPFKLSPGFFNLPPVSAVPTTVLTTLGDNEGPSSGVQGAGKAGFYSISTLKRILNPRTGLYEYLYKVFSPEEITPKFLSDMLGVDVPETFTGLQATEHGEMVEPISWYYPHIFHSYPKALPRVTFQDPILRDGLYYTSGIESFISTMETSALMGMNVARLAVDDFLLLKTGGNVHTEDQRPMPWSPKTESPGGSSKIDELSISQRF